MTYVPPPFDPELSAALDLIKDVISPGLTVDEIDVVRQGAGIEMLADLDLTLDGFFAVEDRSVEPSHVGRLKRQSVYPDTFS